jgi:hypothetical protein
VRWRISAFHAASGTASDGSSASANIVSRRARWKAIHAAATSRPDAPSETNMARQPMLNMIQVRTGGATARPMVCDELMIAVARPRVAELNHSLVLRMPDG